MNVGRTIDYRRFPKKLAGDKALEAKDKVEMELDKIKRQKQADEQNKKMQPVLLFFKNGYEDVLGAEEVGVIVNMFSDKAISVYSLIVRIGEQLERRGLPRRTWETIATRRFEV